MVDSELIALFEQRNEHAVEEIDRCLLRVFAEEAGTLRAAYARCAGNIIQSDFFLIMFINIGAHSPLKGDIAGVGDRNLVLSDINLVEPAENHKNISDQLQ